VSHLASNAFSNRAGSDFHRFKRNRTGAVVHRAECRHNGTPWFYANDLSDEEVAAKVEQVPWLRWGRCCEPPHTATPLPPDPGSTEETK
jgi:hypothetical protein